MKLQKLLLRSICALHAALIFCSCGSVTTVQETNTSESTNTNGSTATLSCCTADTLEPMNTNTEISIITDETHVIIDYTAEHYAPYDIMDYLDPLLIRWDDIIEDSVTNQSYNAVKDENGNWVLQYMDYIAVKVTVLKAYIDTHPYPQSQVENRPEYQNLFSAENFQYVWVPCQYLNYVTEGEQAIVMLQDFDPQLDSMPKKLSSTVKITKFYQAFDSDMQGKAYPSIIPVLDNKLQLHKEDEQVWSHELYLLMLYNSWLEEVKIDDAPLFRDGMTLEEFDQMIELVIAHNK